MKQKQSKKILILIQKMELNINESMEHLILW